MRRISRVLVAVLTVVLVLPILTGCGKKVEEEFKGTITISGAWALYPMMVRWGEEFHKLYPDVQFDISAGGAGKGMADALAGTADIGMVSRDVTAEEEANGAYWVGCTKDAVFAAVSADNPVLDQLLTQGVTRETFMGIYISGTITTWGQVVGDPTITDEIHVYTRSDSAGAPDCWAKFLGGKQEDLLGIGVYGDPGLLDAVVQDALGIGYNNLNYAYDSSTGEAVAGAVTVPIDANANGTVDSGEEVDTKAKAVDAVATGRYPSPPARVLNLVTNGKPTGLVQAFEHWVLTDGQAFIAEVGYIELPEADLKTELAKLD